MRLGQKEQAEEERHDRDAGKEVLDGIGSAQKIGQITVYGEREGERKKTISEIVNDKSLIIGRWIFYHQANSNWRGIGTYRYT